MFGVDNYRVSFSHTQGKFPVIGNDEYKKRDVTFIAIRDTNLPEENNLLSLMWVVRYYKDQPNRNNARKFVLDKALRNLFPGKENKELRTRFWQAYFEKLGGIK